MYKFLTNRYILPLFFVFTANFLVAQSVTTIYTDFKGYWTSGIGVTSDITNDKHHLCAFTYHNGSGPDKTYSTGVNDEILSAHNVDFIPGNYRALPIANSTATASTYVGLGKMYGGVLHTTGSPPLTQPLAHWITDGVQGLDLGTAVFNMAAGTNVQYKVDEFDIARIGDNIPDIIATQVGDPSGASDQFKFVDAAGNTVGNPIVVTFSGVPSLGKSDWAFYIANQTPMPYTSNPTGVRDVRLLAWDLADFGLNQTNIVNVSKFVHILSGTSDQAFMAYNTTAFRALTEIEAGCNTDVKAGLWLQGNNGPNTITDNSSVTVWADQSAKAINFESTNSLRPVYRSRSSESFNFNPYVAFENNSTMGFGDSPADLQTDNLDVYIVARPTATSGNNVILGLKSSADPTLDFPSFNMDGSGALHMVQNTGTLLSIPSDGLNIPALWQINYRSGTYLRGSHNGKPPVAGSPVSLSVGNWYSQLGGATGRLELAELLVFPGNNTSDQRNRLETYLAIKYGISLAHHYVSGSGSVIWDYNNAQYNNRIFGLGREDCQGLAQKQSRSVADPDNMVAVGMGALYATNKLNTTALADGQFIVIGDNNASLSEINTQQSGQLCLEAPLRRWRMQATGNYIVTQSSEVRFNIGAVSWSESSDEASDYYLLIDRNGNGSFNDPADSKYAGISYLNGNVIFANVIWDQDGNGTDYFTIAKKNDEAPVLPAISGVNSLCTGRTTMVTNSVPGGAWSSSDPEVASVTSAGVVNALAAGTATLTYTYHFGDGCSVSTAHMLTVHQTPDAPVAQTSYTYCVGETASELSAEGEDLLWYTSEAGGTGSAEAPTPITTEAGIQHYYVSQTNAVGCESSREHITVIVYGNPSAGADQDQAGGEFVMDAEDVHGTWSIVSVDPPANEPSVTIEDGADLGTTVFVPNFTSAVLRWTDNSTGCYDEVTLTNTLPLPLNLLDFRAEKDGGKIICSWLTAGNECLYYDVERSSNGLHWVRAGRVDCTSGKGDKSGIYAFTFTDHSPYKGSNYYRLKHTEISGASEYSVIRYVSSDDAGSVSVHPNPGKDLFFISGAQGDVSTDVYDSRGNFLFRSAGNRIDLTHYPQGTYHFRTYAQGKLYTFRVVQL